MKRRIPTSSKLAVELLEPRRVLAAITVTNNTDEVNGDVSSVQALIASPGEDGVSLREAIEATNATPGADEIDFDFGHDGPETIVLGGTELHISDDLTINGPGTELLSIDGNGESRVLKVDDGDDNAQSKVSITALRVTGGEILDLRFRFPGYGTGGGVYSTEDLHLRDAAIVGNAAVWCGGVSSESLVVFNSTIESNTAEDSGGGLCTSGKAHIADSTIAENSAESVGGGVHSMGDLEVLDTIIIGNTATLLGGGVFSPSGFIRATRAAFEGNYAREGGGFAHFPPDPANEGGSLQSAFVIAQSSFSSNTAEGWGSAIYNTGAGEVIGSTIANQDSSGAAVQNAGDLVVSQSSFVSNIGRGNGALSNTGRLWVDTSKFIDNTARQSVVFGVGGALSSTGEAYVNNSLFSSNEAGVGASIYGLGVLRIHGITVVDSQVTFSQDETTFGAIHFGGELLELSNSVVGNTSGGKDLDLAGLLENPSANEVLAHGLNIISDSSVTGRNILNVDPMLDDNGVPMPGSPAIDAGDTSLAVDADGNPLKWDVRGEGFRRVLGYGVDIGAFEADGFLPGDATGDDVVNLNDFNVLKSGFGVEGGVDEGDFNGDGVVDLFDFNILKANFGELKLGFSAAVDFAAALLFAAIAGESEDEQPS